MTVYKGFFVTLHLIRKLISQMNFYYCRYTHVYGLGYVANKPNEFLLL